MWNAIRRRNFARPLNCIDNDSKSHVPCHCLFDQYLVETWVLQPGLVHYYFPCLTRSPLGFFLFCCGRRHRHTVTILSSFSRETLVRFRKEMVKAFPDASTTPSSSNRMFPADNLNDVLTKIGMNDNLLLSKNEIDVLLAETGTPENRMIPVSKLIQLV